MHTLNLRSFLWFTTGVALTLTSVATFGAWRADAVGTTGESTFVPITPCRLFDTRSGPDNVGTRKTPIAQTDVVMKVTGTNGQCTIPSDATGVAMNVTIVNPTASSFLQAFPSDVTRPEKGSNLNFVANQAPVPNKVDVKLGATGAIKFYNNTGTVDALADIVGYYKSSTITDLESRLTAAETSASNQATQVQAAMTQLTALQATVDALSVPEVIFAEVDADGNLFGSSGVVDVLYDGFGSYFVEIDRSLTGCLAVASAYDPGTLVYVTDNFDATTITIEVTDLAGVAAPGGFNLAVACTPA